MAEFVVFEEATKDLLWLRKALKSLKLIPWNGVFSFDL